MYGLGNSRKRGLHSTARVGWNSIEPKCGIGLDGVQLFLIDSELLLFGPSGRFKAIQDLLHIRNPLALSLDQLHYVSVS